MALDIKKVKEINNLGFDGKKTEELLAHLKEDGTIVDIEDLSSYIRKQGLIVKLHVGRKRNYVEVSPKVFGVNLEKEDKDVNGFFKEHFKAGKIKFIPESYEKILTNIESSARMERTRSAIGYDNGFMTLEIYDEFKKSFNLKSVKYFEKRDEIVAQWDNLLSNFKGQLSTTLEKLNCIDKEKVYKHIISKLPSKEAYENSFYMSITGKAFPVTENLDMFDENIQKEIKDGLTHETVSTLYEVIGNALNDAFENVCKVLYSVEKNTRIPSKTLGAVKKTAKRVGQKNIFNNPKIESIKHMIIDMVKLSGDIDVMAEKAEIILATIYGYAVELNIEKSIKSLDGSPLSKEELVEIYDMVSDEEPIKKEETPEYDYEEADMEKMRA